MHEFDSSRININEATYRGSKIETLTVDGLGKVTFIENDYGMGCLWTISMKDEMGEERKAFLDMSRADRHMVAAGRNNKDIERGSVYVDKYALKKEDYVPGLATLDKWVEIRGHVTAVEIDREDDAGLSDWTFEESKSSIEPPLSLRPFTFSTKMLSDLKLLDFKPTFRFRGELLTREAMKKFHQGRFKEILKDIDSMSLSKPDGDFRLYNTEGYFEWLWDFDKTGKYRGKDDDNQPLATFTTEDAWVGHKAVEENQPYQKWDLDVMWKLMGEYERERSKDDLSDWDF